jgi:hypothetical protein
VAPAASTERKPSFAGASRAEEVLSVPVSVAAKPKPKRRPRIFYPATFHFDRRIDDLIARAPPPTAMLTTVEMSRWFAVSHHWFENARYRGDGPPFVRVPPQHVRYHCAAVKTWLAQRRAAS